MTQQSPNQDRISKRHRIALLATSILAVVIAVLTLSSPHQSLQGSQWDKFYHFIAFMALAFPCALLYARTLFWVLPTAILFGGAIELIQPYVGRGGEWADFVADVVGVAIGAILGLILRGFLSRRARIHATDKP
ncbi:MAG: VanZ family protein [Rhodobacteraceae bacterium]|nr:VanZ family protein [Paracoccaceae bacterium]